MDGQVLHVAQRDRLHDLVVDHDVKRNERRDARDHQQSDEATAQHAPKQGPHRVVASDAVLAKLRTHISFLLSFFFVLGLVWKIQTFNNLTSRLLVC